MTTISSPGYGASCAGIVAEAASAQIAAQDAKLAIGCIGKALRSGSSSLLALSYSLTPRHGTRDSAPMRLRSFPLVQTDFRSAWETRKNMLATCVNLDNFGPHDACAIVSS